MPSYYNEILIIGPGNKIDHKLLEFYKNSQRLILGDGINPISKNYLKAIKKLIGPNTRIDIIGHGSVSSDSKHTIRLLESTINTEQILTGIGALTKQALHIHLWSCYVAAANEGVTSLPSGSFLITHSPKDDNIWSQIAIDSILKSIAKRKKRLHANQHLTPVEEYVADFNHNVLQTATISKMDGKTMVSHTTSNADIFFTEITEQRRYLESEVQTIREKFKSKATLDLSDSEVKKYMETIIAAEATTKRGLKKLARTSEAKQAALHEMIAKAKLNMVSLLNVAAQQSSRKTFEALDVQKNLLLDLPLYRSIYFGNKDVAHYIITRKRFNLSEFNKIITKFGLNDLIETCATETKTNEKFWKIAVLIECNVNLGKRLNKLSSLEKISIMENAANYDLINCYVTVLKSLLNNTRFTSATSHKFTQVFKEDELVAAINKKFFTDLNGAKKNTRKINQLIESYKKFENKLNINLNIDFEVIKEKKLREGSTTQKVRDFCDMAIANLVKYIKNIDYNKYITRFKNIFNTKIKKHLNLTPSKPLKTREAVTKINHSISRHKNKPSHADRVSSTRNIIKTQSR